MVLGKEFLARECRRNCTHVAAAADECAGLAVNESVLKDLPSTHLIVEVEGLDRCPLHARACGVADVAEEVAVDLGAAPRPERFAALPARVCAAPVASDRVPYSHDHITISHHHQHQPSNKQVNQAMHHRQHRGHRGHRASKDCVAAQGTHRRPPRPTIRTRMCRSYCRGKSY